MEPWHNSIQDLWELLHGRKFQFTGYPYWERESLKSAEQPLVPYNVTEPRILHIYPSGMGEESKNLQPALKSEKEGKKTQTGEKNQENTEAIVMEGRVLGGCMDCLVNLLGTKYDKVCGTCGLVPICKWFYVWTARMLWTGYDGIGSVSCSG